MRRPINRLPLRRTIRLPLINIKEPIPLRPPISARRQLNNLRRSDFAHPQRQQSRHRPGVEDVACVQESLLAGCGEAVEAREGLFDRGVQAGGVDRKVCGEIFEMRGERVGGGGEVGGCGCENTIGRLSVEGVSDQEQVWFFWIDGSHRCRTRHLVRPIACEGKRMQGLRLLVWRGRVRGGGFRSCCLRV